MKYKIKKEKIVDKNKINQEFDNACLFWKGLMSGFFLMSMIVAIISSQYVCAPFIVLGILIIGFFVIYFIVDYRNTTYEEYVEIPNKRSKPKKVKK